MIPTRPTIFGGYLQTCAHGKRPFDLQRYPYSTLNEKHEILANAVLQPNQIPGLMAWCIGDGGHRVRTVNQRPRISTIDHEPEHAALYNQVPFVLREVGDDLPADLRVLYALRKEVSIGGRNYIAYWAKRLIMTGVVPSIKTNIPNGDGTYRQVDYETSAANLNPIPPDIDLGNAVTTSGEFRSSSMLIPVNFGPRDVQELLNVGRILYGSEDDALISEIAFVTGVDRQISIQTPTGSVNFLEMIAAQIDTFVGAYYQLVFENQGFDFTLETGVSDPLLGASAVTSVSGLQQP